MTNECESGRQSGEQRNERNTGMKTGIEEKEYKHERGEEDEN